MLNTKRGAEHKTEQGSKITTHTGGEDDSSDYQARRKLAAAAWEEKRAKVVRNSQLFSQSVSQAVSGVLIRE